jgi:hypothetical protein
MGKRDGSPSLYGPELFQLMLLYAYSGIEEWEKIRPPMRAMARGCLGQVDIAETREEAAETLNTAFRIDRMPLLKFIPMPQHAARPKFGRSFFLPICQVSDLGKRIGFELFIWIEDDKCLAFRYEPAHESSADEPSAHDYGHVQLCHSLLAGEFGTKIPKWIPDSYPAMPLAAPEPLSRFLALMTAVHGNSGPLGVKQIVRTLLTQAGLAGQVQHYIGMLDPMLIPPDSNHG